jgi:hypothetical protein
MAANENESAMLRRVLAAANEAERLAARVAPPTERELIQRALDLPVRGKLQLVRRLWHDQRVRDITRAPLLAGAVYAVAPLRLMPPIFGPLRRFEKLIGLTVLLWLVVRITPEEVLRHHLDELERPGRLSRLFRRDE